MSEGSKICPVKFGFAFGLIWGLGMLLIGWADWLWEYGEQFVNTFASVYYGFEPTFWGGIVGFFWGFVDFFIFGFLVFWVYNCCTKCCKHSK